MKKTNRALWRSIVPALSILLTAHTAAALPRTGTIPKAGIGNLRTEMIGGRFASISDGPYALVVMESDTDGASCSGSLIGPREVLTAAHCVKSPAGETQFTPDQYTVVVGGEQVGVSATYYNAGYDPEAPVDDESSQYDLGMLILDQPITGTSPIPVLKNLRVHAGDVDTLYGFGTNEQSDNPDLPLLDYGKFGSITVDSVGNGVFHSTYGDSQAASCAGDSGGGVVKKVGTFAAVLGVVSAGTTATTDAGACQSTGSDDDSIFVDLQTATSQDFLAQFPEIVYAQGGLVNFKAKIDSILPKLSTAQKQRVLSNITKQSASAVKTLVSIEGSADNSRIGKLNEALTALRGIKGLHSTSKALKLLKQGIAALKVLSALGAQ